jgi:phage-related protein
MPVIQGFTEILVKNVIPAVKSVTGWMQTHKSTVHLLVAVLGPLLTVSLAVAGAMKLFGPLFTVLRPLIMGVVTAMRALNLAFLTNPITLIIIAIIALVAGFIWLWKNCESFRNFWKAAWRDIQQWAADAGHWIVSAWNAVIGWFKGIPRWFHDVFFSVWRSITGFFGNAADWVAAKFNGLMAWFAALPGRIVSFFAGLGSGIVNAIGNIPILGSIIHAIPGLASGGTVTQGGATWVGERGPELLNLPSGSKVTPMGAGGGTTVNVVVNVAGHVKAEKDLAVAISGHVRNELRRVGARNGGVVGLA